MSSTGSGNGNIRAGLSREKFFPGGGVCDRGAGHGQKELVDVGPHPGAFARGHKDCASHAGRGCEGEFTVSRP